MELNNIPKAFSLPLRLSLISSLVSGGKNFNNLKNITKASEGNISVQLSKLENWGYVKSKKSIKNKKMNTQYFITDHGLTQLEEYVELLENIIKSNNN